MASGRPSHGKGQWYSQPAWEHNSQGLGTQFPRAGNTIPKGWEYDSQGLGTRFPRAGNTIPKGWEYDSHGPSVSKCSQARNLRSGAARRCRPLTAPHRSFSAIVSLCPDSGPMSIDVGLSTVAAPAATPILCRRIAACAAKCHVNGHGTTMRPTAAQTSSF